MPTYEYKCKKCGSGFEVRVAIAEKDKVRCPQCESNELQEIYAANISKAKGGHGGSCAQSDSCPSRRFGFG